MLGAIVISIVIMITKKKSVAVGSIDNRSLTGKEKLLIWALTFLSPFVSGAIYYYGWKKSLPLMARQANKISWFAFLLMVLSVLMIIPILLGLFKLGLVQPI